MRDEGETTVLDLKGRRVGVDVRGSGMYLLAAALAPAGLTITDVEIVPLLQPEMEAAFLLGDVNAVVVSEPWMTELRAKGARVFIDSNAVSPPIYRVLAVTESALQERGDELVELLSAHLAMVPRLQVGGDEKEMNAILRREGLTRGKFTAALGRVHHLDVMENRSLLGIGGSASIGQLSRFRAGSCAGPTPMGGGAGIVIHIHRSGVFHVRGKECPVAQMPPTTHHGQVHASAAASHLHRQDVHIAAQAGQTALLHRLLRLHLRQCSDAVAQLGGLLVLQHLGVGHHLCLQFFHHLLLLTQQKALGVAHIAGVIGRADQAHAGARAAADLVKQARPRTIVEHRVLAGAQLEHLLDQLDGLAHRPGDGNKKN